MACVVEGCQCLGGPVRLRQQHGEAKGKGKFLALPCSPLEKWGAWCPGWPPDPCQRSTGAWGVAVSRLSKCTIFVDWVHCCHCTF